MDKSSCNCQVDFKSRKEKVNHMKVVHAGYLGCDKCLEFFLTSEALENHKSTHESIPCSECGVVYNGRQALHAHIKRAHDTNEFVCDICSKVVGNNMLLTEHKRRHHKYKDQSCKICFKTVSHMREHMLSLHTDEKDKPHQCDKCEKGFPNIKQLRCHQFSVHLKSRPYKCRFGCGMDYNDTSNRRQHEKRKHGGLWKPNNDNEINTPGTRVGPGSVTERWS